ncbi:MAG TPA: Uma2 family endonuclease, partial [Pyrinomonadaceae bacterium]|nr:Uma2 family endonuclease [Pyrinomonadaceae bacterium]
HGRVAANLTVLLGQYVKAKDLGDLCGAETGFKLESNPDTVRAPDIAFIPKEQIGVRSSRGFGSGAPYLAVEVLSPDDRKREVEQKTLQWLACGAESVWLVNPKKRTVEVIRAEDQRKLFHESDELVDDTVPGFRVEVSKIFE